MLQVRLFGQFDVQADGTRVVLPTRAAQSLFAFLILTAGTVHRREKLAGQLWPDTTEDNARANLRRELWRIRRALANPRASAPEYILAEEVTIGFNSRAEYWLDAAELTRNVPPQATLDARINQVSVYQGELLPGFYEDWVVVERQRLQALFEGKIESLLEGLVAEQRWATVSDWGEKWLALNTAAEPAYRALMLAHAASGDMSKVVALYQRCVEALRNELGVDPSPETRTLYEELAQGLHTPARGTPTQPAGQNNSLPLTQVSLHNLPPRPKSFVGRTQELADLKRYLSDPNCRLVTVLGAGGIGKTRLALEAACENFSVFPDGVYFVPLQPLASSELVIPAIARVLEFSFSGQTNPAQQLAAYLREVKPRSLLLLDNLEHLLGSAGALEEILMRTPSVKLLVTSRERLRLDWEWVLELGGLEVPGDEEDVQAEDYAAVQLFQERARRVYPRFSFSQEGRSATQICRLVQGHPLAIELAVAWVRTLSCAEIAQRIRQNLNALTLPQTDNMDQHRSIAATFEHSYALLSPQEQMVFRRLALFEGGFEREAAERIAGATLNDLLGLVDKSLAQRDAAGRYEMHELLRRYAERKLQVDDREAAGVAQRMSLYYLDLAQTHRQDYEALERDWNNLNAGLRLAHQHRDWQVVLDHVAALRTAWEGRGRFADARQGYRLARDAAQACGDSHALAAHLRDWGKACIEQGDYQEAEAHLAESLVLSTRMGDARGRADALYFLARISVEGADYDQADRLLSESRRLREELDDRLGVAEILYQQAFISYETLRYDAAVDLGKRALEILEGSEDQIDHIETLCLLAEVTMHGLGALDVAEKYCQQALSLSERVGDQGRLAMAFKTACEIHRRRGELASAREKGEKSLALLARMGDRKGHAHALFRLCQIDTDMENYALALQEGEQSLAICRELADPLGTFYLLQKLGDVRQQLGQARQAQELWAEALSIALTLKQQELADSMSKRLNSTAPTAHAEREVEPARSGGGAAKKRHGS